MELLAWAIYALLKIGPYVAVAIGAVFVVVIVTRLAFQLHRRVGEVTLSIVVVGTGFLAYKYLVEDQSRFQAACASGVGTKIFQNAVADSYAFAYTPNRGGGYLNNTDVTFEQAIVNVANRRVQFVELPDSSEDSYRWGIPASLGQFRPSNDRSGYFKVFVSPRSTGRCRWLMPNEVKPLQYETYLSFGMNHKLNEQLNQKEEGKECIAIEYLSAATSRYLIEFSISEKVAGNLLKHEIRFVDRNASNALIASVTAYEHKIDGVYSSVAFSIGNRNQHPRCPINPFEGNLVRNVLLR